MFATSDPAPGSVCSVNEDSGTRRGATYHTVRGHQRLLRHAPQVLHLGLVRGGDNERCFCQSIRFQSATSSKPFKREHTFHSCLDSGTSIGDRLGYQSAVHQWQLGSTILPSAKIGLITHFSRNVGVHQTQSVRLFQHRPWVRLQLATLTETRLRISPWFGRTLPLPA